MYVHTENVCSVCSVFRMYMCLWYMYGCSEYSVAIKGLLGGWWMEGGWWMKGGWRMKEGG